MTNEPSDKNSNRRRRDSPDDDIDAAAETYLDLWQENMQRWAREPEGMEKWRATAGKTPPGRKKSDP